MKTFSQTYNIAEMKKYFQYKLERTDKSRISSPQIHSHSGDCSSELQEKNNVNFLKKDWLTRFSKDYFIIVLPEIKTIHWGKKGQEEKCLRDAYNTNTTVPT